MMGKSTVAASTAIGIDMRRGAFHYYSMPGEDHSSLVHHVRSFAAPMFSEEFFARFREALAAFFADAPSERVQQVSLILPDEAIALDHIRLPAMRSARQMSKALDVKLSTIYANREELQVVSHLVEKNKQYLTFSVAAIQKRILSELMAACSEHHLLAAGLTYASAAAAVGIGALSPELAKENYLLLDIKDVYSRFSFVVGGRAAGSYTLPFGSEFLAAPRYVQEDMLFDHSLGEVTVLNARERAKAKKLTMLEDLSDAATRPGGILTEEAEEGEATTPAHAGTGGPREKILPRKTPRKLPQFMLRDIPEDAEGIACENFRVFVKWALSLLHSNPTVTALGAPKQVLVNLPAELSHVLTPLAAEEKETGIPFVRFTGADTADELSASLELFGGLHLKKWPRAIKF